MKVITSHADSCPVSKEQVSRWNKENCPNHHYRAMGMCPICGDKLESLKIKEFRDDGRSLDIEL